MMVITTPNTVRDISSKVTFTMRKVGKACLYPRVTCLVCTNSYRQRKIMNTFFTSFTLLIITVKTKLEKVRSRKLCRTEPFGFPFIMRSAVTVTCVRVTRVLPLTLNPVVGILLPLKKLEIWPR